MIKNTKSILAFLFLLSQIGCAQVAHKEDQVGNGKATPKKLAVLVVHGMGDQDSDFADGMIEEIEEQLLDEHGINPNEIAWKPVWWAPILSAREAALWSKSAAGNNLDYSRPREFAIHSLSDALAYRKISTCACSHNSTMGSDTYTLIHKQFEADIQELHAATILGKGADSRPVPLIIISHSLGCLIVRDYVFDRQNNAQSSTGAFVGMKTLSGVITFGCNIPLFSLSGENIEPFAFPGIVTDYFPMGTNPAEIQEATKWLNFYDPDDILGWPLRPLSEAYSKAVDADIDISVGRFFTAWNPASHLKYWEDSDFTTPVADMIAEIMKLL